MTYLWLALEVLGVWTLVAIILGFVLAALSWGAHDRRLAKVDFERRRLGA